jgi:hypothetical protein
MKIPLRILFPSMLVFFLVLGQSAAAARPYAGVEQPHGSRQAQPAALPNPDDVYWDDRFGGPAGAHSPNGQVCAIAVDGKDVYVAGDFTTVGGKPANYIARWDSTTNEWFPLGGGLTPIPIDNCQVRTLQLAGRYLYVGGVFSCAGCVPGTSRIARWNIAGQTWEALSGKILNGIPTAMAYDGTRLYVAGITSVCPGSNCPPGEPIDTHYVASYTLVDPFGNWSAVGEGFHSPVLDLAVGSDGLFAVGTFKKMNGDVGDFVARWDGGKWNEVGGGTDNTIGKVAASGKKVFVGGLFHNAGGQPAERAARWDGSAWSAMGSGLGGVFYGTFDIAAIQDHVYYVGDFTSAGGAPANKIARWDDEMETWSALGSGLAAVYGWSVALGNDSVYAGGPFQAAGGKPSLFFALWHTTLPRYQTYFPRISRENVENQ